MEYELNRAGHGVNDIVITKIKENRTNTINTKFKHVNRNVKNKTKFNFNKTTQ